MMNNELSEKRILFESLSQIMSNQQEIKKHLGLIRYYGDDYYTKEMIDECNAIVSEIRWEECNKKVEIVHATHAATTKEEALKRLGVKEDF